jgi:aspartyl protease family protein
MSFSNLQDGDWQNLLYLSLLLVMLFSGLVVRRNPNYSKILKNLAIWGVFGFVLVALYSYRFEFSDFKNRILGEINPNTARISDKGKLIINLSKDGHFYLNIKINNTPIRFMVDTGASDIVINKNDAKRIGINLKKLHFNKAYQTANGRAFGASIILKELEISGVKFQDIPASVNSADMGVSLLGMSFLRKFRRYEFYQDKLILEL